MVVEINKKIHKKQKNPMTRLDIISLCLRYGDKVHIVLTHKDKDGNPIEADAFFTGFRNYDRGKIRDFYGIYPVFAEAKPDGTMGQRLLGGSHSWSPESIQSIQVISEEDFSNEAVSALVRMSDNLAQKAHRMLLSVMKRYAEVHPGRPTVYIEDDDAVAATLYGRYGDNACTIHAVTYKDGRLLYDAKTSDGEYKDYPDSRENSSQGVYVDYELLLLKAVLASIEEPCIPDDEDFFDFLKVNARVRWNDRSAYRKALGEPGPVVTVKRIHEFEEEGGPVDGDTPVIIDNGTSEPVTVKASELEPLAEEEE